MILVITLNNKKGFNSGQTAYIIENNHVIKSVTIIRVSGNLCTIKIGNGAIRVSINRLFVSEEEAKASIPQESKRKYRSPYDYM